MPQIPTNAGGLPPLYDRWMTELLQTPIPEEPDSTCLDCAMCSTKQIQRTKLDHLFDSETKCCTYFPKIPNFLAGKILLDQDPLTMTGRLRFLSQMNVFTVVTPLGVLPPPAENARYRALTPGFGKDPDLRCPYYIDQEGGLCGIWKYRNAKCATFFCKHSRGQTGLHFWRALKDALRQIEETLSIWCIHELKVGEEPFRELFPLGEINLETFQRQSQFYYSISKQDTSLQKHAWGDWYGKERSFLEECSRLVDSFMLQDIRKLNDPRIDRTLRFLQSCFDELKDQSLPESLKAGAVQSCELDPKTIRVWGYSQYDPIDVPRSIFESLNFFDGRKLEVVRKQIQEEQNAEITDPWLRRLFDFGILVRS